MVADVVADSIPRERILKRRMKFILWCILYCTYTVHTEVTWDTPVKDTVLCINSHLVTREPSQTFVGLFRTPNTLSCTLRFCENISYAAI